MASPMEAAADAKGQEFLRDAERKLKEWSLFNKAAKHEEAAELFSKAAAQFKIAKKWKEAGDAFQKAAKNQELSSADFESNHFYTQAAKAYKNDPASYGEAVRMYELCIAKHRDGNKFSTAAKLCKELAEMHESENKYEEAMQAYSQAADYFRGEDSATSANQCMLKVADYAAGKLEDYKRAIDIYEDVAEKSLGNNLTKWSVTDYLFKAALCHFNLAANEKNFDKLHDLVQRYAEMAPNLANTLEYKLLTGLVAALDERDVEMFEEAVQKFDQISKLDTFKTNLLLKLKNKMMELGENVVDEDGDFR